MSGLENIISRLESDCAAQCGKIAEDAANETRSVFKNAEDESRVECEKIIADAEKRAEAILKKAESTAQTVSARTMLAAKVSLIDETLEAAVKKLQKLDDNSYFAILLLLAKKYAEKGTGIMYLSAADKARLPEHFAESLENIVIAEECADISDGFILKYGDIEINCTFEAMLNASRDELKALAGSILFG